jgi:hypothetical protein
MRLDVDALRDYTCTADMSQEAAKGLLPTKHDPNKIGLPILSIGVTVRVNSAACDSG